MSKIKCHICSKDIEPRGMGGHLWGIHGIKVGPREEMKQTFKRLGTIQIQLANIKNLAEHALADTEAGLDCRPRLQQIIQIAHNQLYVRVNSQSQPVGDGSISELVQ